jgi:hypothetical protein
MRIVAALSLALVAAGCGGSGGEEPRQPVVGENPLCDPVAQAGCASGWKCTWINVTDALGAAGCVPAGTVPAGGACAYGADGPTTGFDDCAAGLVCIGGTCTAACTLATGAGCSEAEACARYAGLFEDAYGACTPTCDPLTQERLTDGAAACGSPDPDPPALGCYGPASSTPEPTRFFCSSVPALAADLTHRDPAYGPGSGGAYLNGCAPGYLPLLRESTGSFDVVCIALCAPAETYAGSDASRQGLSPYSCPDAGATAAAEECRFWWFLEGEDTAQTDVTSGLGFCFDPTKYLWDDDGDPGTPEVALPSCSDLPDTDTDGDGMPQHLEHGCGPRPTT